MSNIRLPKGTRTLVRAITGTDGRIEPVKCKVYGPSANCATENNACGAFNGWIMVGGVPLALCQEKQKGKRK